MGNLPRIVSAYPSTLAVLVLVVAGACAGAPQPAPANNPAAVETQSVSPPQTASTEVIVYASDLPSSALSEWEVWEDPSSPGGKFVGVANTGEELDPPPENDPHITFDVPVKSGVPYRCWIHMKVGPPEGVSEANKIWVQFSGSVDQANQEVFKPDSESYLTAQGPTQQGWVWVSCDLEGEEPMIYFGADGQSTVRLQAGMEGVGFDQFVLSHALYLENPPAGAVVEK